jgi:hypothetical protein
LTYDCNKERGWKIKGHGHRQFDKLYVILWENSLWYTRVTNDGGPCSDDELESDDMSTWYY